MKLDRKQRVRMSLGATIGLPSPYAAVGDVSLDQGKGKNADTLVHITHAKSHNAADVWSVRAGDIAAIEEQKTSGKGKAKGKVRTKWHVGLKAILKALKKRTRKGTVYVREEAQVLLSLEYGVSANDSVDVAALGSLPKERTSDEEFGTMCVRDHCC